MSIELENQILIIINKINNTKEKSLLKDFNNMLDVVLKEGFICLSSAQTISKDIDQTIEICDKIKSRSEDCVFAISFYDDIMNTTSIYLNKDKISGVVIDKMTDGAHWRQITIFIPKEK